MLTDETEINSLAADSTTAFDSVTEESLHLSAKRARYFCG